MIFFTIGVYNSTENEFFKKLTANKIDMFCDIRQRRAVRGSKYSFVNSNKLQEKLSSLNIKYMHVTDLAPAAEIRDIQKKADLKSGTLSTQRKTLCSDYVKEYTEKVLNKFDFESFLGKLKTMGANNIVFFCVEENPNACHRSLITERLKKNHGYKITHI